MDIDLAIAADKVILTTERIVSNDQIRRAPDHTKIPFFAVDAVVELPFGCAPHECYGVYEPMLRHMQYYVGLVNNDPVEGNAAVSRALRPWAEVVERLSRYDRRWTSCSKRRARERAFTMLRRQSPLPRNDKATPPRSCSRS